MRPILLLAVVWLLTGCSGTHTLTPYPLQQYPATWTPAPTPTSTPYGPTATLVVQHTLLPLPTLDPNSRLSPNVPRGTLGLWADVTDMPNATTQSNAVRARVLLSQNSSGKLRSRTQFLLLETGDAPDNSTLTPEFNGIVLTSNTVLTATGIVALRKSVSPRPVLASAFITDAVRLDAIMPHVDGVLLQNFLRTADTPPGEFPTESEWNRQVETLAKIASLPDAIVLTELPFAGGSAQTLPQQQAWTNYALASFLLAANNTHTFFGITGANQPGLILPDPELQLGAPATGIFKANGVYQRGFAQGLVLVNPTSDKHSLSLSRPYRDPLNKAVTQLEMLPHTGMILTLAE